MANFFENDDNLNLLKQDLIEIYKAKTMLGLLYPYKELKIDMDTVYSLIKSKYINYNFLS